MLQKTHCNLKSMLSFALSKLKPINQLVTKIVLQPKSPIPNITSLSRKRKVEAKKGTDLTYLTLLPSMRGSSIPTVGCRSAHQGLYTRYLPQRPTTACRQAPCRVRG
jgi:hypothetical protein